MTREDARWKRPAYTNDGREFHTEDAARFGLCDMDEADFRNCVATIATKLFENGTLEEWEFTEIIGCGFERVEPSNG